MMSSSGTGVSSWPQHLVPSPTDDLELELELSELELLDTLLELFELDEELALEDDTELELVVNQ